MTLGIQKLAGSTIENSVSFPPAIAAGTTTGIQSLRSHTRSFYVLDSAYTAGSCFNIQNSATVSPVSVVGGPGYEESFRFTGAILSPWTISFWIRCNVASSGNIFETQRTWQQTGVGGSFAVQAGTDKIRVVHKGRELQTQDGFNLNASTTGWHHVYIVFGYNDKILVDGRSVLTTTTTNADAQVANDAIGIGGFVRNVYVSSQSNWSISTGNTVDVAQFGIWGATEDRFFADGNYYGQPIPLNKLYPNIDLGWSGKVSGLPLKSYDKGSTTVAFGGYPAFYSQNLTNVSGTSDDIDGMRGYVAATAYTLFGGSGSRGRVIDTYAGWLSSNPGGTLEEYYEDQMIGPDVDGVPRDETNAFDFFGRSSIVFNNAVNYDVKSLSGYNATVYNYPPPTAIGPLVPSTLSTEVPYGIYTTSFYYEQNNSFTLTYTLSNTDIVADDVLSIWATYEGEESGTSTSIGFSKPGLYYPEFIPEGVAYPDYLNLTITKTTATLASKRWTDPPSSPSDPATHDISLSWTGINNYFNHGNKWNHYALVCNTSNSSTLTFTLYINGQSLGSKSGSTNGLLPQVYNTMAHNRGTTSLPLLGGARGAINKGTIQQLWFGASPTSFNIQDFYNNGYVDLGDDGINGSTQTLPYPTIYETFNYPFTDLKMTDAVLTLSGDVAKYSKFDGTDT